MKEVIMLMVLGPYMLLAVVFGQTVSEWVNQQGTQIRYLKEQIAELLLFKSTLEKGYQLAQHGTGEIFSIKQGDYAMHEGHFDSLLVVKPVVSTDDRVAMIRTFLADTRASVAMINEMGQDNKKAGGDWYSFALNFGIEMASGCATDSSMLDDLLTNGRLSMDDAARLERLDVLYDRAANRFLAVVQMEGSLAGLKRLNSL